MKQKAIFQYVPTGEKSLNRYENHYKRIGLCSDKPEDWLKQRNISREIPCEHKEAVIDYLNQEIAENNEGFDSCVAGRGKWRAQLFL